MSIAELRSPQKINDLAVREFGTHDDADVTWTLASLGAGAGRHSDILDLGSVRPWLFTLELDLEWATAPIVGEYIGIWAVGGTDTVRDAGLGTADAAISSINLLQNLKHYLGAIQATAATATSIQTTFSFRLSLQYIQLAAWNYSAGDALSGTAANNYCILRAHAVK